MVILVTPVAIRVPRLQISHLKKLKVALFRQPFGRVVGLLPPSFRQENRQSLQDVLPLRNGLAGRRAGRMAEEVLRLDERRERLCPEVCVEVL